MCVCMYMCVYIYIYIYIYKRDGERAIISVPCCKNKQTHPQAAETCLSVYMHYTCSAVFLSICTILARLSIFARRYTCYAIFVESCLSEDAGQKRSLVSILLQSQSQKSLPGGGGYRISLPTPVFPRMPAKRESSRW